MADIIMKDKDADFTNIDDITTTQGSTQPYAEEKDIEELSFESSEKHKTSKPENESPNAETKKRKLDDEKSNDNKNNKRNGRGGSRQRNSNNNNSSRNNGSRRSSNRDKDSGRHDSGEEVSLKVLIPQGAAGGVIGHKGEKIGLIQRDTQTKIKMSKTNEHYPNTTERVCMIVGTVKSVVRAYELMNDRIQDKPDRSIDDERLKEIKILIPSNTAGLLIGKSGSHIKSIKDSSGAFVQVSHKTNDLAERIVTIEGSEDKRHKALKMVVEKIVEDPQHNSITNLVYPSHHNSRDSRDRSNERDSGGHRSVADFVPGLSVQHTANSMAGINNLTLLIVNSGGSSQMTSDSLMDTLGSMGYMQNASKEIIEALGVMMRFGLIVKDQSAGSMSVNLQSNRGNDNSDRRNDVSDRRNDNNSDRRNDVSDRRNDNNSNRDNDNYNDRRSNNNNNECDYGSQRSNNEDYSSQRSNNGGGGGGMNSNNNNNENGNDIINGGGGGFNANNNPIVNNVLQMLRNSMGQKWE